MSRRKIEQLRALARSTTFAAERETANQLADKIEAKMQAEEARQPQNDNPYTYAWKPDPTDAPPPKRAKQPWRGSPSDHDDLYREALERALKELEARPGLSDRVRDILARKAANAEMVRRFGMD